MGRPGAYEGRFRGNYLEEAKSLLEGDLADLREYRSLEDSEEDRIFKAGPGESVFGLLYRISEELDTGLEADLFAIPLRQCAIELCECADVNPYLADSEGTVIAVTADERAFREANGGTTIGNLRDDRQRFVRAGGRQSFLTPNECSDRSEL
ncbi:MAG: hypothetical protein ILP10_08280 [Lachnospiraceae bacterium]|nr:hypothetical protein [Lachnospiraceae bacterium]